MADLALDSIKKIFNPKLLSSYGVGEDQNGSGDQQKKLFYRYSPKIILAVNVAIVTGRPLLVRGPSGSGKSSLAEFVARELGWRYYKYVVTSRSQAQDLLWSYDAVMRLSDATSSEVREPENWYIDPGILWWVFDPVTASTRGYGSIPDEEKLSPEEIKRFQPGDPIDLDVSGKKEAEKPYTTYSPAVVLIDEIDKADPDFPNNLLVPFGSYTFDVEKIKKKVSLQKAKKGKSKDLYRSPLFIITTNEERRLPKAFLRRCVVLEIDNPSKSLLLEIMEHAGGESNIYIMTDKKTEDSNESSSKEIPLYEYVLDLIVLGEKKRGNVDENGFPFISIAEYIDAARAAVRLIDHDFPELGSNKKRVIDPSKQTLEDKPFTALLLDMISVTFGYRLDI